MLFADAISKDVDTLETVFQASSRANGRFERFEGVNESRGECEMSCPNTGIALQVAVTGPETHIRRCRRANVNAAPFRIRTTGC